MYIHKLPDLIMSISISSSKNGWSLWTCCIPHLLDVWMHYVLLWEQQFSWRFCVKILQKMSLWTVFLPYVGLERGQKGGQSGIILSRKYVINGSLIECVISYSVMWSCLQYDCLLCFSINVYMMKRLSGKSLQQACEWTYCINHYIQNLPP